MKSIPILFVSLFILGCGSNAARQAETDNWIATLPDPNADYGEYPQNYEASIRYFFGLSLKDPDSAEYTDFSAPIKEHKIESVITKTAIYGYSACAIINAKNSFGGYSGPTQYWFFFKNGQLVDWKDRSDAYGKIIYRGRPTTC